MMTTSASLDCIMDKFYSPAAVPVLWRDGITYGVAVDLGTTQIRRCLGDMGKERRLAGHCGLNFQTRFGADVLTGLAAASESEARAREISRLARDALGEALQEIATEECRNLREIRHLIMVGDTAMLALVSGKN